MTPCKKYKAILSKISEGVHCVEVQFRAFVIDENDDE
jgi:hypothetical protein